MAARITLSNSSDLNGSTESTRGHPSTTATSPTSKETPLSVAQPGLEKPATQNPLSLMEFGTDESLWNPDRTRYAGIHRLTADEIAKIPADSASMFKYLNVWAESNLEINLTPEELEQRKRWADAQQDKMMKNPISIEEVRQAFGGR